MKKKLFSLMTALLLCLFCALPAFAEMPLVMDTYELFKPEATAELEQKAQDASAGHGVNVYLLTVADIGGQNVREFAKDWYRSYDLGYGEGKSGILFLIALDSRDYVTITYGGGVTAFTDYRIAQIEDKIVPLLSDGSYYKASDTYIEMCADTLDFYAEKGAIRRLRRNRMPDKRRAYGALPHRHEKRPCRTDRIKAAPGAHRRTHPHAPRKRGNLLPEVRNTL